jgi:uncharacterized membrane protein
MLQITVQYIPFKTDVAFLAIKRDYVPLLHYRVAFFVHVFTSIFVLLAGFTQFSDKLRSRFPKLHRRAGWFYILVVLLLAAPSGFIIGIYANGGLSSRIGFCLLAAFWMFFTYKAVRTAVQKKFPEHRRWMIRSFALTLSAITLRAWKFVLVAAFAPKPMDVYQIVAWLGWVVNLIAAECWIFYTFKHANKKS